MAEAAVNNKNEALLNSKLDLNLRKGLVKCYIWGTAVCGAESGELGKGMGNIERVLWCGAESGELGKGDRKY